MGLIFGIHNALWWPAISGVLPAIVPKEKLKDGNALEGLLSNFGYVVGALMGGTLVTLFGSGWALLVDAFSFLIAGVLVWKSNVPPIEQRVQTSVFTELKGGWFEFKSRPWVVATVIAFTGINAIKIHLSSPLFFAMIVIALSSAWDFSLALKSPLIVTLCGAFVAGIALEIFMVNWSTALQTHIPEESFPELPPMTQLVHSHSPPLESSLPGHLQCISGYTRFFGLPALSHCYLPYS